MSVWGARGLQKAITPTKNLLLSCIPTWDAKSTCLHFTGGSFQVSVQMCVCVVLAHELKGVTSQYVPNVFCKGNQHPGSQVLGPSPH